MQRLLDQASLTVPAGQAVSGHSRDGCVLEVMSGQVWITVAGDPNDYWLDAGQSLAILPARLVVIEAARHAVALEVRPRAPNILRPPRTTSRIERLLRLAVRRTQWPRFWRHGRRWLLG